MTPTVQQGPELGASEHYAMCYLREVTSAVGGIFGYNARPLVQFFVETQVYPILWRLVKVCEEHGRKVEKAVREYDKEAK